MRRWVKRGAFAAVIVAGIVVGVRYLRAPRPTAVRFETARTERGRILAKVTASGTLSALVTVQIGSQVSGRIDTVRVDFGSRVKKGQVIATIDPRMFRAALSQARANRAAGLAALERARVQAEDSQRQFERQKRLAAQKLVAQADSDTAEANAKAARAQVHAAEAGLEQAQAAFDQAKLNLDYTTIYSPIDGVVVSRAIDRGQTVAASFQSPTLFIIAQDLSKMQVDTNVSEADVGRVRPGMKVTFAVDAYPGQQFEGTVRQVRDAAQTVQSVVTYDAVIDVDNPGLRLKPGMTTNVTFLWAERQNVMRIPNAALRFRPDLDSLAQAGPRPPPGPLGPTPGGAAPRAPVIAVPVAKPGERLVWRLRGDRPEPAGVRLGISDGSWTEMLSGPLREGEPLVTEMIVDSAAGSGRRP
jgi:HlyD family secretion protein